MKDKKKIVAFFIAVTLGGGALVVRSAELPVTKPKKTTSYNPYRLSENDSNHAREPFDTKELFFKMMGAVLLVVALGIATIYISKRFLPKITNLPGKKIHILETVHLGPRKAVHLLQIGNQQLLIGSTSEGITALADVTDVTMDSPSQETDND